MHHYTDHILELYVLNSPKVNDLRDEIEAHLTECFGCRKLVEEITSFHNELAEELKQTPVPEINENHALVKRKQEIEPYFEPFIPPVTSNAIVRSFQTFSLFVRKNPVKTAAGSFVLLSTILGMMYFGFLRNKNETVVKDLNPTYYNYNLQQNFLEIYNKENELIWKMPTTQLPKTIIDLSNRNIKGTDLVDLNNEGENEIITILRKPREQGIVMNNLQIIRVRNNVIQEIDLSHPFQYLSRNYYSFTFYTSAFVILNMEKANKQLIVSCNNTSRSPSYIGRLDTNGKFLGRYWQFGQGEIHSLDVNNDGKNEIVFCGVNDTPDTVHQEYAAISVIDPVKIINDKKSTASPGFVMPYSDAELFYIQIPHSIIDSTLKVAYSVSSMQVTNENLINFSVLYHPDWNDTEVNLDFYFTKRMEIVSVTSNNRMDTFWQKLLAEGKTKTKIDKQFLNRMKEGIRYWDGQQWHKEWTMVKHDLP